MHLNDMRQCGHVIFQKAVVYNSKINRTFGGEMIMLWVCYRSCMSLIVALLAVASPM